MSQKFVVITFPRTGSELLIQALQRHSQVKVMSEILNPMRYASWRDDLCRINKIPELKFTVEVDLNEPKSFMMFEQNENLAKFVKCALAHVDGFKITSDQINLNSPVLEALKAHHGLRIVFLTRQYWHSAISYWFAIKSQIWQRSTGQVISDQPSVVDEKFVERFCSSAARSMSFYKDYFCGHESISLNYDLMIENWDLSMAALQSFLNLTAEKLPKVFEKRIEKPLRSMVKNYNSLRDKFSSLGAP